MKKMFPFIRFQRLFVTLSVIAVGASLYLMATKGLNFGIDFKGGFKLQYQFAEVVSEDTLRELLDPASFGNYTIQRVGKPEEQRFIFNFEQKENETVEELSRKVRETLVASIASDKLTLEQEESVGPRAGQELRRKGQLALIFSWVLMLIYIGFRFDFYFAPGAIIALIHDVLVTLGFYAFTGREVSLTTIAALLTIIGYSVNDTIVIYDRVRENLKKHERMPLGDLINLSVNETLSRTIITSLTVFFVVIILYLFGSGDIQGFGFAMTVGVVAGSYSTIFVASPVYIFLKKMAPRFKKLSGRPA